jgi:hypothetical protein
MDLLFWGAGVALVVALALLFAPARAKILIDTPTSTARAEIALLWGLGPLMLVRALPQAAAGAPLAVFSDAARIAHALMTPGLADAAYEAVRRLFHLNPAVARLELGLNLGDSAQNLVVQTAAQAALAAASAALRDTVRLYKCEARGAELICEFKLIASPLELASIYGEFKNSKPAREFRRRLKAKPKPNKKTPREVRAA